MKTGTVYHSLSIGNWLRIRSGQYWPQGRNIGGGISFWFFWQWQPTHSKEVSKLRVTIIFNLFISYEKIVRVLNLFYHSVIECICGNNFLYKLCKFFNIIEVNCAQLLFIVIVHCNMYNLT